MWCQLCIAVPNFMAILQYVMVLAINYGGIPAQFPFNQSFSCNPIWRILEFLYRQIVKSSIHGIQFLGFLLFFFLKNRQDRTHEFFGTTLGSPSDQSPPESRASPPKARRNRQLRQLHGWEEGCNLSQRHGTFMEIYGMMKWVMNVGDFPWNFWSHWMDESWMISRKWVMNGSWMDDLWNGKWVMNGWLMDDNHH